VPDNQKISLLYGTILELDSAVLWSLIGLLLCITIIGIPFSIQHFKLAKLTFIPFGAKIHSID